MRKRILLTSAFAVAVLTVGLTQQTAEQPELSATELENIEALAIDDEYPVPVACLPDGKGCALNGRWHPTSRLKWSDGEEDD